MDHESNQFSVPQPSDKSDRVTYKFDIFKGEPGPDGKVLRLRSVGTAILTEGQKTYTVYLKTFLNDVFFLLPDAKRSGGGDFSVLTRQRCKNFGRNYYWNNVGDGKVLTGANAGLMRLTWDLFGANDLYMSLHPAKTVGGAGAQPNADSNHRMAA